MSKQTILVLLESPGKVSKVQKIFNSFKDGNTYIVKASKGHISKLADTEMYNIGIKDYTTFEEDLAILDGKKQLVKELKADAKKADMVYIASDSDNEGEFIAYCLKKFLAIPESKYQRVYFLEITEKGIKEGLNNLTKINDNLVNAARTRTTLDKMIGYRISPQTRSLSAISAGRVQSAVLNIIADREKIISDFIPEEYFELYLPFVKDNDDYIAQYKGYGKTKNPRIDSKDEVDNIIKECNNNDYLVKDINVRQRISNAKEAYSTALLLSDASTRLGYGTKKTTSLLQKMYEAGYITYIRTDSTRLSSEFIDEAKEKVISDYGEDYWKGFTESKKKKVEKIQDAHEAIRPTHIEDTPTKLSPKLDVDEHKLYNLIYRRTIASLMSAATIEDTTVEINNGKYRFDISGHKVLFDGYLKVYDDEDHDKVLPEFEVDEKIDNKDLVAESKETKPLPHFSESSIVKEMKDNGIGRPSTYNSTITTLLKREYISLEGKSIRITELGKRLSTFLKENYPDTINTSFTADMEKKLDDIENNKTTRLAVLTEFWEPFNTQVKKINNEIRKNKPTPKYADDKVCPCCGNKLVYRESIKQQKTFLACSKFPRCRYTETIVDPNAKTTTPTNIKCPKCNEGYLIERHNSKTGELFYGCSNFFKGCKCAIKEDEFNSKYRVVENNDEKV